MAIKQCLACGQSFQPRPQVPLQTYCSTPSCQQHRKRQWHHNKLQTDPDYQENQQRAQQSWIERNPDYWRQYVECPITSANMVVIKLNHVKPTRASVNLDLSDMLFRVGTGFQNALANQQFDRQCQIGMANRFFKTGCAEQPLPTLFGLAPTTGTLAVQAVGIVGFGKAAALLC